VAAAAASVAAVVAATTAFSTVESSNASGLCGAGKWPHFTCDSEPWAKRPRVSAAEEESGLEDYTHRAGGGSSSNSSSGSGIRGSNIFGSSSGSVNRVDSRGSDGINMTSFKQPGSSPKLPISLPRTAWPPSTQPQPDEHSGIGAVVSFHQPQIFWGWEAREGSHEPRATLHHAPATDPGNAAAFTVANSFAKSAAAAAAHERLHQDWQQQHGQLHLYLQE
jgi:hypothetical protein